MKVTIKPSQIKGTIAAPASKSSMQRACAAALLSKGTSIIRNPGHSNDDKAALDIIQKLGAKVEVKEEGLEITSDGIKPVATEINCGESGLSIRMFTPIAALSNQSITITGEGSLASRPMDFFDNVLPQLGITIGSNDGKLPLTVKGPLTPKDITVDGSLSSQFLTGLLMAFGAAGGNKTITVKDLKSKPYIDLTLDVMKQFGAEVEAKNESSEFIVAGTGYKPAEYTVEGDWSSGAFLLVAGAISGPVTITGLDLSSTQADSAIVDALMAANAAIAIEAKGIRIHPTEMTAFDFDATDCPDLFPPLVALAAYCKGTSKIRGVSRLVHKESNRAVALQDEFDMMGVFIEIEDDVMLVHGNGRLKGADVHSHHDHRIAMACAIAALRAKGETVIDEAQAVKKSYPDFYEHLKKLGANVSLDTTFKWHE